jgi:CHAD domain-containing protein
MRPQPIGAAGRRKAAEAAGLDCAAAFKTIALDAVRVIKAHQVRACAGDAEAVHQIRVGITRLRAAVAFFAPIVADAQWLRVKREITWLNGSLGAARDSDVVLGYARRQRYRAWVQAVIGELEQRRMQDHRRLARCLHSARMKRLVASMARWVKQGAWLERYKRHKDKEALPSYCAGKLERWRARLVRNGKRLKNLGEERRHRLRIRAKRFRYMIEALTETIPLWRRDKLRGLHRPAKRLQRALGDMRDLERLADLVGRLPSARNIGRGKPRPPGYRRRTEKLLVAAIAAHRELKRAKAG